MPRAEDIAWKFVIRLEGKKWRCPYCKNKYSGSVTRVKSHLLKQPKEGVAPCTKVPEPISTLVELLHNQVRNKEDIAWNFIDSLGENKWRCHHCREEFFGDLTGVKGHLLGGPNEGISICTGVPEHVRMQMQLLLDEVAEEESREVAEEEGREAHGQSSMEPQSQCMPTQAEVAEEESREVAEEQSREAYGQSPMEPQSLHVLTQAEVAEEESREAYSQSSMEPQSLHVLIQAEVAQEESREANSQFHMEPQSHDMLPPAVPVSPLNFRYDMDDFLPRGELLTNMANFTFDEEFQFHETLAMPSQAQNSHGESSLCSMGALEDKVPDPLDLAGQTECSFLSPCPEEMPMNDQQTPTGASLFQDDQLQTPMEVDPPIASQHTTESPIIEATDLEVPEVATNIMCPSLSQDMNRGSPIMNVRSICANDEEIRNLKRKVEELYNKEAVIKEQMEIESAASSVRKKPRILVERWLKETERARNNFQIIGQANAGTLPPMQRVETLTREVEELIGKMLPQPLLIEERDAKGVKFLERKLTGKAIHRNIKLIWDHLTKNHGCKLGIYGMGGVGKTTIMMHIHNRLLNDATFDGVVFITVSKDFSIYKLQSDIGKALKCGVMEDEDEKKRAAMLSEHLERKKNCVLILDDVWECLDLEEVGIPVRANGCKLVLTTRSFDVCCQMHCQEEIKIKPLSQIEAESLFLEELGSKVPLNSETKAIVKSIVEECAGLPIGVITMARSMRGVTDVFEWRDSLVKLEESSKGQTDMEKKVLMNLKFSYDRLSNPDVQQCFLSCALYPEDELIDKFELVEFFIDQGLIGGLKTRREQNDRGLTILNKLRNVCLLEDHGSKMKMHDLIRDMALHIMSTTSIVKAQKQLRKIPPEEYWTDALEKVSLMNNQFLEFPLNMSPNCPKLSTLLLNGCLLRNAAIPDSFFRNLLGLKVLNLSENNMTELPNSISELVNLRALFLRECRKLCRIPYLGNLTSLRKLDARDCTSLEVLTGLDKLVNLRYLDLTKTRIERLPKGTLDRLLYLRWLKVGAINKEDITKLGALETFKCYLKSMDDFNKCVMVIEQSDNRRYYDLTVDLEKSEFIVEVSDDVQFGNSGKSVYIWDWDHAIVSVGGECTGTSILIPRDVETMTMRKCSTLTYLPGMGPLDYLEKLKIEGWKNLGLLCGGQDEEVIDIFAPTLTPHPFPRLKVLKIDGCPKLKYIFGHGFKSNLPHLQEIYIHTCGEMVGIIAAVTSPPPHLLPFFPRLKGILVEGCGKMKRVVGSEWMSHFPDLRRISAYECEKMEEIIGGPPPYVPVKGISLESLHVYDCNNMRKLFPHEWLLHLRNLQSINVSCCNGMVEMISEAGQHQEGSMTTSVNNTPSSIQPSISLPKLEKLVLQDLPQLKSICKVPISCDSIKYLTVDECPELKGIPLQLRLCEIEELPHIWVEDEEKWKTLMWDHPEAQAILRPYLQNGRHAKRNSFSLRQSPPNAIELDARGKGLP